MEHKPSTNASALKRFHDAVGMQNSNLRHPKRLQEDHISADDETEREPESPAAPPRKRGKPSRWEVRREREDLKLIEAQETKGKHYSAAEAHPVVSKKIESAQAQQPKEEDTIMTEADQETTKKKGRPIGWRKGIGLTYAELKQMSMKEREEHLRSSNLKPLFRRRQGAPK